MEMDEGARGWMFKTAIKNFWRVSAFCEFEDLIQEGNMAWWRVNRNYPLSRPPQIMGYFKVAFIREIDRMSVRVRTSGWLTYQPDAPDDLCEGSGMAELMAHAPRAIAKALRFFQSDEGARRLRAPSRVRANRTRETTAERIDRIAGQADFEAHLRAYLRR